MICVSRMNVRMIYLCMHIRPGNFILGAQPTSSVIHIPSDWDEIPCLKHDQLFELSLLSYSDKSQ